METKETGAARTLTLTQLAAAIGVGKGTISKWQSARGCPREVIAGIAYFNADEFRAWMVATNRGGKKKRGGTAQAPAAPAPPAPVALSAEQQSLLKILRDPQSSSLDRARAACRLAAETVASAAEAGKLAPADLSELKKSLEELRRAEAAGLELAERNRELIPLDRAVALAGELSSRFVELLARLETALPGELEAALAEARAAGAAENLRPHFLKIIKKFTAALRVEESAALRAKLEKDPA